MLESLRGLGYTTSTALADLVDNSIAAGADTVDLLFDWRGEASTVRVLDDGRGMDAGTLERAMRLGERSPRDERAADDLGRFGLGLKTASFSQCRRLTVATRTRDAAVEILRWDLDFIAATQGDGWLLLEGAERDSEGLVEPLRRQPQGTLVLWELPDRMVSPGFAERDFLDLIDRVERHLSMVFHRLLDGRQPRLRLRINGQPIEPWDPFLVGHAATWSSPVEHLETPEGRIAVQGHVLPHRDRLTPAEHERAAGLEGWTAQQGFYVYRNERLLLAGSWLGLGRGRAWTREESHRLARLRIDLPNRADDAWKINILKSTARVPVTLRARLTTLAEDVRARARRVFAHRGKIVRPAGASPAAQAWTVERTEAGTRYRIDRTHPAVRAVLDDAGERAPDVLAMLRTIEETVPLQRVWLDTAEGREVPRTGFAADPPDEVRKVLAAVYRSLLRRGVPPAQAREQLLHTEPFDEHPALVRELQDPPDRTDNENAS